jgi:hypothetical protein
LFSASITARTFVRSWRQTSSITSLSSSNKAGGAGTRGLIVEGYPERQPPRGQQACLRRRGRLYKIGIGRAHKGRQVKLLIADRNIRVIDLQGELIRELTLDPSRNYQPISPAYDVSDVPTHVSGMS